MGLNPAHLYDSNLFDIINSDGNQFLIKDILTKGFRSPHRPHLEPHVPVDRRAGASRHPPGQTPNLVSFERNPDRCVIKNKMENKIKVKTKKKIRLK